MMLRRFYCCRCKFFQISNWSLDLRVFLPTNSRKTTYLIAIGIFDVPMISFNFNLRSSLYWKFYLSKMFCKGDITFFFGVNVAVLAFCIDMYRAVCKTQQYILRLLSYNTAILQIRDLVQFMVKCSWNRKKLMTAKMAYCTYYGNIVPG